MKRVLSILLATALMVSLASVAMASPALPALETDKTETVTEISTAFHKFDSDNSIMYDAPSSTIAYGNTIYFPLLSSDGELIAYSDAVKGASIKTRWETNGDYVASVEIARMKTSNGYGYFLAIKFVSSSKTAPTDVIGDITLKKTSGDYKFESKLDFNAYVRYTGVTVSTSRDIHVIYDSKYLYDFDGTEGAQDEEFELTFDEIEDAYFTVNTIGQGDLVLAADGDYNSDIASKYPNADLDFFNGNGASFNKIGSMFLPAAADSYLYEVLKDGTLATIPSATYDEYEEGFTFKTRTLGTYIVSDEKLPATERVVPETPAESEAPAETPSNPSTGAAA